MKATGYCFQIEMALASMQVGAEVIQVPITFVERNFGKVIADNLHYVRLEKPSQLIASSDIGRHEQIKFLSP